MVKRTLRQPYDSPFKFLAREPNFFQLQIDLHKKWRTVDRLKPSHILQNPIPENRLLKSSLRLQLQDTVDMSVFVFRYSVADWRGSPVATVRGSFLLRELK
ncbi:hypothetical protein AVEN_35556-1 [Araneus ventricosus]|uniref:Uncharacterized protein n=1 Tax=Araneus ventricosus TaxID=182803 RepID=A0A4Y2CKA6_ARAVE|nr:hypothetical protein AVEN_35556-1 [Araneus ventricosus]